MYRQAPMRQIRPGRVLFGMLLGLLCVYGPSARAQETAPCNDADARQVRLRVSVTGMYNAIGDVVVTVYPDDAAHFLDGKYRVTRQHKAVVLPTTEFCLAVPAPGRYAVALMHDENQNGKFDTTLLGLPAEGYGFSRNPSLFTGPPGLDKVVFEAHPGDNPISVTMKYF